MATLAAAPPEASDDAIRHALNRLTFGPRPGDIARVKAMGLSAWIDAQLTPKPTPNPALEARLSGLTTLTLSSAEVARQHVIPEREARRARQQAAGASGQPDPAPTLRDRRPNEPATGQRLVIEELASAKLLRAIYSDRQLEEVLVDFWFNHFNVFATKGRMPIFITSYERETIRPHVFGTFRELLGATAKNPAMLFYLDNWLSTAPEIKQIGTQRRPVRLPGSGLGNTRTPGINENYGRELLELHTLGVDGGYTQQDVVEVARAFTGWTIDPRTQEFVFRPALHDDGPKRVLGHTLPAGGGIRDGERVLDILASHPSTARHIAYQLAQRFISDTPPQAVVDRAATTFRRTGGDLTAVVRTIVTSPEFSAPGAVRAKVKTPFEFVVSAVRALDADVRVPRPLLRALQQLGMPSYLCQPPTGYANTSDAWVSSGALVTRMNLALEFAQPRNRAFAPLALEDDVATLRTRLIDQALGGTVAAETRDTVSRATTAPQVVALILGSPEFQRR
jgi:uncharacterized protein (DUF1800 family)